MLTHKLIVIIILATYSVIECVPTKISSKTSPHLLSPSRKLNTAMSRSNQANVTGELANRLNEDLAQESNSTFTTDDVQFTMTNDKQMNVSMVDQKPFEENLDNKENLNKNIEMNQLHYNNQFSSGLLNSNLPPISQADIFNTNDQPEQSIDLQCVSCSTSLALLNSNQLTRCCQTGYSSCCGSEMNSNRESHQSVPNNNAANIVSTIAKNSPVASSVSSSVNNPTNQIGSITNQNSQPAGAELSGTKTKSRQQSSASKIKNQDQSVDQDVSQIVPNYNTPSATFNTFGLNPNLFNGLYLNNKDRKMVYANGLNNLNYLAGLPANLQYSNLNGLNNLNSLNNLNDFNLNSLNELNSLKNLNNFYSNLAALNANLNPTINPILTSPNLNTPTIPNSPMKNANQNSNDPFARKTANSNRLGTKTAPVNNANSMQQSTNQPGEQQSIQNHPTKHPQSVNQNENVASDAQQANTQRLNTRNQSEKVQQQQSGFIQNLVSHIPFIGFNPVTLGFSSSPSQQSQQLSNQVAQIITTADGQVIAINPQAQNAQLITPNQLQETQLQQQNQLATKGSNPQQTAQQSTNQQASGLVSSILSRPYNLYQRIGGYLRPPFGSSKPVLQYSNNQYIPLDLIPSELLTEQNLSNLQTALQNIQYYSGNQPILGQVNPIGQMNPLALYPYLQNDKLLKEQQAKSARRSRRLFFF